MPETDHYDVSTAEITNKLTQLKLVKDRSSKDIDTNQNEEETKKLETRTSLDDNTDDDEDKDPTTDKEESVCVKKVMQVRRPGFTIIHKQIWEREGSIKFCLSPFNLWRN